jgi:hypothetical protein
MASFAVLGTLAVRDALQPAPYEIHVALDLGSVGWRAPSDFLLETPGRELLTEVPAFTATATATVGSPALPPALRESTTAGQRRPER